MRLLYTLFSWCMTFWEQNCGLFHGNFRFCLELNWFPYCLFIFLLLVILILVRGTRFVQIPPFYHGFPRSIFEHSCWFHMSLLFHCIFMYCFCCIIQAKVQKSCQEKCNIVVSLNQLKNNDIRPLIDVFLALDLSDIDSVDVLDHGSTCVLNEEHILSLMNATNLKLRVIDLSSTSLKKDFLRYVVLLSLTTYLRCFRWCVRLLYNRNW